ncbi:MAG: hypothetical protein ACP5VE_01945 [Chthonomonadales bacterium]
MICNHCGADNNPGRERCAVCGNQLVELDRILQRDRKTGHVLRAGIIGLVAGAAAAIFLGIIVGALFSPEGRLAGAVVGGWVGLWVGAPVGAILGALAGALLPQPKQY